MKILAGVFVYNRPKILHYCLESVLANTLQPDELILIDDGSDAETRAIVDATMARGLPHVSLIRKGTNRGAAHSSRILFSRAGWEHPQYLFPIEADYVFRPTAFADAIDVLENTNAGKCALGIAGYDHPNTYSQHYRDFIFPDGMKRQMGEDNVNREALYKKFKEGRHELALVSNTCPTSYLAWQRIELLCVAHPKMRRHLWEICDPQPNPNYWESGEYARKQYIDDGLLSHCLSYYWNKWALANGIDRMRFGAWLNVTPSLAENVTGGGVHATCPEMMTDGHSPTWK